MKLVLHRFVALAFVVTLIAGCGKKEEPPIAQQAEEAPPSAEPMPPDPAPVEPAKEPELAAADQAYDAWFKKYNLDLKDPNMLDQDTDGDGFANRDEFLADTNPLDPNARPGIHKTIRLKEYNEVRLPVILESVQGETARIKRSDGGERVETVRVGETLKGLNLKVERVKAGKETDKRGDLVDVSTAELSDPSGKERTVLRKDMPARTAASFATLVSEDGQTSIKVKEGETFQWPPEPGVTYKVVDLRSDQVVVQQLETDKMWTVTKQ
ncbi:MAG: thrombospondin type 3 repeat-containing protein [Verrucomicrobiota bacterium]|nr:thrombospondin type 3 repeat-containing protein [Verrucomicrobiota bacterium]